MSKPFKLFLCFVMALSLGGCRWIEGMFVPPIYVPEELWFKKGVEKQETKKFYIECYPKNDFDYEKIGEYMVDAEKCMLENGFKFRDYGWLHNRRPHSVCSKIFAEFHGLKNYMDWDYPEFRV